MKLTGKPIYPAELAPTAKVTAAETAIAKLDTDYKAADKTLGDKNTTQDTAIAAVKTTADKAATDIAALTTTVTNNKAAADTGISSAIAEWDKDRPYKVNNIVIRNKTFFLCLIANTNKDPIVDTAGNWSIFVPNESNSIFANRSPTSSDVHPSGLKWYDVSWGADSPLVLVSLGNGAWQYLNQITLSRVRFYLYGTGSTYQSNLNSIKFFKKDGTQAPNGWWVWGSRSSLGGQQAGANYTGQGITAQYNASGWAELEPSSNFDLSESITKVTGSTGYATVTKVEFHYSNGGLKTFTPGGGNLATCDPAIQARIGDSVASVLGETLTAAKLTNATNTDAGRLTGVEFVSAWNALYEARMVLETPVTHAGATETSPGNFIATIASRTRLTYGTTRSLYVMSLTMPAGVYQSVTWGYFDANGLEILSLIEPIGSETSKDLERQDAPADAVSVRVQLLGTRTAEYIYPLV